MLNYERQELEEIYKQLNNTEAYYPKEKTIMQLFVEQVARTPDATAAIFRDHSITYKELDIKSNQIAYLLRQDGFGRDSIIGIMVERSLEMIIGIYGILKSGAAYLPIQPDTPVKRFEHIISDSNTRCLLTQTKFMHTFADMQLKCIDLNARSIYALPEYELKYPAEPLDVMYVMYTSGSTGNPKGVMVENHSAVNRINWMQKNTLSPLLIGYFKRRLLYLTYQYGSSFGGPCVELRFACWSQDLKNFLRRSLKR